MSTDDEKNICLCNITWKKLTFLLSSFYLGDVVSYDLHVVLITKMCDMTYLILYSTQGNVFMLVEIVFQSSCITVEQFVSWDPAIEKLKVSTLNRLWAQLCHPTDNFMFLRVLWETVTILLILVKQFVTPCGVINYHSWTKYILDIRP